MRDMSEQLYSRILGCMVGNAIGDAFGGAVEFMTADQVREVAGGTWVQELLPYPKWFQAHEFGVWAPAPPRGTGTDDTRNNHIFAECVIRNHGQINSQLLAIEYLERYRDREKFYPGHADLAEKQYRWLYELACAELGMQESVGQQPPWALPTKGATFPMLIGLIHLAFAGLLYCGDPEQAYRTAFALDFMDIGYAKDATGMLAAMISAALPGGLTGKELVKIGLETNPFVYGDPMFGGRVMADRVNAFLALAEQAESDQALVNLFAREVASLHPYDPIDVLGLPMLALYASDGDALRTLIMAANDRYLNEQGELRQLRDVDCVASVAGALVGALRGVNAFPDDWVADVLAVNKDVYNIDIEATARKFYETVYGKN